MAQEEGETALVTVKDRLQLHEAIIDNDRTLIEICFKELNPNLDLNKLEEPSFYELIKTRQLKNRLSLVPFRQSALTPINLAIYNVWNEYNTHKLFHSASLGILNILLDEDIELTLDCANYYDNTEQAEEMENDHDIPKSTMELALYCMEKSRCSMQRTAMARVIGMLTRRANFCREQKDDENLEKKTEHLKTSGQDYRNELLKTMLEDTETHDVIFVCPDGETVTAHRSVLMASTPYFKAAFSTNWKENTTKEWKTENSSFVMEQIVNYIYNGRVNFDAPLPQQQESGNDGDGNNDGDEGPPKKKICNERHIQILKVYAVAHEFQMRDLLQICQKEIVSIIAMSNMVDILEKAAIWDESNLKLHCFEFMKKNAVALLSNHKIAFFAAQNEKLWKEFEAFVHLEEEK